jgi:hypothetical protein
LKDLEVLPERDAETRQRNEQRRLERRSTIQFGPNLSKSLLKNGAGDSTSYKCDPRMAFIHR